MNSFVSFFPLKSNDEGVSSMGDIHNNELIGFYWGKLFSESDLNTTLTTRENKDGVVFPLKEDEFLILDNSYAKANKADYRPKPKDDSRVTEHDFFVFDKGQRCKAVGVDELHRLHVKKDEIASKFRNGTYVCDYEFAKLSLAENSNGAKTLGVQRFRVVPFVDNAFGALQIDIIKANCTSSLMCFQDQFSSLAFAVVLMSTKEIKTGEQLVLATPDLAKQTAVRNVNEHAVVLDTTLNGIEYKAKLEESKSAGSRLFQKISNNLQNIAVRRTSLQCHLRRISNQCSHASKKAVGSEAGPSGQPDANEEIGCDIQSEKFILQTSKDSMRTVWQVPTYEFYSLKDEQRCNPQLLDKGQLQQMSSDNPIGHMLYYHLNNSNFWDLQNEEIDYMMECSRQHTNAVDSSLYVDEFSLYVDEFTNEIVTTRYLKHKMNLPPHTSLSDNKAFWKRMFVRYFKAGSSQHKVLRLKIMLRMSLHRSRLKRIHVGVDGRVSVGQSPLDEVRNLTIRRYKSRVHNPVAE